MTGPRTSHSDPHPTHRLIISELLFMGRDYPRGQTYFRHKLYAAFASNMHMQSVKEITDALARGEYVRKGLLDACFA